MTFKNISKASEVVIEDVKTISPVLRPSASNVIDYYNPIETALKDAAVGALTVKIPVFDRAQYVTLSEGETFTVTPASDAERDFYIAVAAAFDKNTIEFIAD